MITELVELLLGRQFAVNEEIGGFDKRTFFRQLFDRDASVEENPFFTVKEGDGAFAGSRTCLSRIKGNEPRL